MNYSIYQQALDLQATGLNQFSTTILAFGLAKYIQILIPQLAYYLIYPLVNPKTVGWILGKRKAKPLTTNQQINERAKRISDRYHRLQGFFTWKLACDLGFFLVVTQYGAWTRALNLPGLVAYTLGQLIIYYYIGQKLILGRIYPRRQPDRPGNLRIGRLQLILSRLFHEEMGVTVNQVPLRVAAAKVFVDYLAMYLTWSLYTIGFFLVNQGEFDLGPLEVFPHVSMISFYLTVYLGYAFSFTLFDIALRQVYLLLPPRFDAFSGFTRSSELLKVLGSLGSMILLPVGLAVLLPVWFMVGQLSVQVSHPLSTWQGATTFPVAEWLPSKASDKPSCSVNCLSQMVGGYLVPKSAKISASK